MPSRPLRLLLDVGLLLAGLVVVTTGFVVDRLDLHDVLLHRWAGYAFAGLAVLHVVPRWRAFLPGRVRDRGDVPAAVSPAGSAPGSPPAASGPPAPASPSPAPVPPAASTPSRRAALAAVVGTGVAGGALGWLARSELSAQPYEGGDVGLFYHRQSALGIRGLIGDLTSWGSRPAPYKRVADASPVALPAPARPDMALAEALGRRRSLRAYAARPLTGAELAWVLEAATGLTDGERRAAPSAGALYPIETYLAVDRVEGVAPGLYHLDVRAQRLEPMREGSVGGDLLLAGLGQDFLRAAPVVVVLTGLFQRSRWKYHARHYRYVCWEGGHIAQNLYLAAEAAGLGACMVGAFVDDAVNSLLRIDGRQEAALGLVALGPR